ncbi:MAG: acyl-ACP--UDP-N-acetylglucosamine O-acyltransferase [Deltaproteobacteria bacterium]|nr:acyl-ACP--UDP-N-acetylglucosamine O-acyltransferase [Deltaproteobacteria bacterium]MBI3293806.1 acyl-ACP--UDP-N-acetylglucosamine O-acyltransferase [Deltaproteobacteria bacterium]
MTTEIHPTAMVASGAQLGDGVRVGALATIEAGVSIGARTAVREGVVIRTGTRIGENCKIYPYTVVGEEPQHLGYKGEETLVTIGNNVTLREYVTVNKATATGKGETTVEDNAFIMAYTHVAHDCRVGKNATIANAVQLAGHVQVGNFAFIGGSSAVTQFNRIGDHCFIGGGSLIRKDLAPYLAGKGNEFKVQSVNIIGLSRNGFSDESIRKLRNLYKIFFLQKLTVSQAIEKIGVELDTSDEITQFLEFVKSSKNGLHR